MRKFKVINNLTSIYGLKIGDVVTLVDGSVENDLYELPERLHGKGHKADMYDLHLNLKENNYIYLSAFDLVEIKDEVKVDEGIKLIRLDITYKHTNLTTRFLVESIRVVDDVLSFRQNGLTHRFNLENYNLELM